MLAFIGPFSFSASFLSSSVSLFLLHLLQVPGILRCGTELSLSQIHLASRCLNSWSDTYQDVRDRIERSGNDHRWEFDRKLLFGRTVHMANICADLAEVAKVLDQFGAFLGPEVRRIQRASYPVVHVCVCVCVCVCALCAVCVLWPPKGVLVLQVIENDTNTRLLLI